MNSSSNTDYARNFSGRRIGTCPNCGNWGVGESCYFTSCEIEESLTTW